MNNLDFEKTQVWASNLAQHVPLPNVNPRAAFSAPATPAPKKPVMKPLSKEEKVILATGGALAIGLGAIVITSFLEDEAEPAPAPAVDLNAPKLNLASPGPAVAETPPPAPEPVAPTPRRPDPKPEHHREPPASKAHHALLEVPDVPEVATRPNDDQTFIEAFNTARAEVGPAGLFVWKHTYYSTFTDKEWSSVPEAQKAHWLEGAEPIIHPVEQIAEIQSPEPQYVFVAERGDVTWTGIDNDGDGQTEILMARIKGQSPMVLMDTDGDGLLDTRYDYDAARGTTFASMIDPISMSTSEISEMEEVAVGPDMGFFNEAKGSRGEERLPVSIVENGSAYVVSVDANLDNSIDAVTYFTDAGGPIVGLDQDRDGQIEAGFIYDPKTEHVQFQKADPLDEMLIGPPEYSSLSPEYSQEGFVSNGSSAGELAFEESEDDFSDDFDSHFNKDSDDSDEYQS